MTASRAPALPDGTDLGGYVVLRQLSSRTQPTYLVQRRLPRRPDDGAADCSVVELVPRTADERDVATLVRIGKRLTTLAHPNLVRLRQVLVRAEDTLVISDFVDAERYDAVVAAAAARGRPLPLVAHLRVLVDVLGGLSALHLLRGAPDETMHLVHGEVCPANVLLGLDGNARLARTCRIQGWHGMADAMGYVSPETRLRDAGNDARADIYGCGVMLWEALAARRLFPEAHDSKILPRQVSEKIDRPTLAEDLGWAAPLADVATRALAADPAARFASAANMAGEIRKIAGARLASKTSLAAVLKEVCGGEIAARRRSATRALGEPAPVASETSGEIAVKSAESAVGAGRRQLTIQTPAVAIPRALLARALAGSEDEVTARAPHASQLSDQEPTERIARSGLANASGVKAPPMLGSAAAAPPAPPHAPYASRTVSAASDADRTPKAPPPAPKKPPPLAPRKPIAPAPEPEPELDTEIVIAFSEPPPDVSPAPLEPLLARPALDALPAAATSQPATAALDLLELLPVTEAPIVVSGPDTPPPSALTPPANEGAPLPAPSLRSRPVRAFVLAVLAMMLLVLTVVATARVATRSAREDSTAISASNANRSALVTARSSAAPTAIPRAPPEPAASAPIAAASTSAPASASIASPSPRLGSDTPPSATSSSPSPASPAPRRPPRSKGPYDPLGI